MLDFIPYLLNFHAYQQLHNQCGAIKSCYQGALPSSIPAIILQAPFKHERGCHPALFNLFSSKGSAQSVL